jgi:hypothetical protein
MVGYHGASSNLRSVQRALLLDGERTSRPMRYRVENGGLKVWSILWVTILLCLGCRSNTTGDHRPILETWQTANSVFKIRISSYPEHQSRVNGTNYLFESAPVNSENWQEIVNFRHDDRPKIPTEQVIFLSDHIAYLYMGWIYSVSVDGGKSWSVWNAEKDLRDWQCCNYQLIRSVQLTPDGYGRMTLNPIPNRSGEVQELFTTDYGQHWLDRK